MKAIIISRSSGINMSMMSMMDMLMNSIGRHLSRASHRSCHSDRLVSGILWAGQAETVRY
jgi:hypothetical protein